VNAEVVHCQLDTKKTNQAKEISVMHNNAQNKKHLEDGTNRTQYTK